jgi:hypothetical protein
MSNTELNVTSAPTSLAQQYGNPVSALTGFTEYLVKLAT